MNSLRFRLFLILVAATGFVWLCAVGWIYFGSRNKVEHVLDTRLQEAARMVSSLVTNGDIASAGRNGTLPTLEPASYERQLSCQIWSLDGHLVAKSSGAPGSSLTDSPSGFSERVVEGETWRVYAIEDRAKGVRVLVGDRLGLREQLVKDLIKGLVAPAILIAPLLGFLIWASLGRGLLPLSLIAGELQRRGADDMSPVDAGHAPREVRPLAEALNALFGKVEAARRHEREITAFAAHELRTPLAGLKIQAQVAIAAADPGIREAALRQITSAVDRTTRLIRQLLAVSRLDAGSTEEAQAIDDVGDVVREIVEATGTAEQNVTIEIDPALHQLDLRANRELLILALRNLHENAVLHMPDGGKVHWGFTRSRRGGAVLFVEDEGPGIPEDELSIVNQRFFRGRHKSASGSGLGLAIVELALRQIGARLVLANRQDRSGLRAEIVFQESMSSATFETTAERTSACAENQTSTTEPTRPGHSSFRVE